MPSSARLLLDFIDSLPDAKLEGGFRTTPGLVFGSRSFRLDVQGMTTAGDWNLQIQVNRNAATKNLRKLAPRTIAGPIVVPPSAPMTAEEIREAFRDKVVTFS